MTEPTFGITFVRDNNEPRPVVPSDLSPVGLVLPSEDADAAVFPLNGLVEFNSSDQTYLTALGTGDLFKAVSIINAQLADFQLAARIVAVRVAKGANDAATMTNIIGNQAAGTGLYALLRAGQVLGVIPRILGFPGYTGIFTRDEDDVAEANPICAVLPAICSALLAHAVVGGPGTTKQDALDWRETINSDRLIPVDNYLKVSDGTDTTEIDAAASVIGIGVRCDFKLGAGVPSHSWANQPVHGIVGLRRYDAFSLTDGANDAQEMLAQNIGVVLRGELGVETAIAEAGFNFVGTDNAGIDPLWQFYNVTRMRDFIHLSLLKSLRKRLGVSNITPHAVQALENDMTNFMSDLKANEHILGFRVGFEKDKNSPENLRLGRLRIFFRAEEPPVLRHLTIDSRRYRPALEEMLDTLITQANSLVA
ncbi:putative major tail sheath protein FI [Afipia carboxidovorans OM5]|uniref:Putative phage tail sheath protein FI n=1 Tax=Afipia carboxidovorans (strain ATCC 49405 / DSM 1227 / KCTC 32145 / OM5) TaxID=504832 RepID=B6JEF8_AFIC5|nr:tail protein [Afipia carboxidovorans]ACI92723.1 putative major tail sheath protein FI [Afipia carboxidovorans OM5]AEI03525.1 putative phage tail sheath protein FI [Afipia carboxidovorans OM4]AEI07102.1 putative phage tail sheath protein FI [Afipia carboxidovorans OM5]